MADKIPKYSDLPLDKNGPHHNAWGLYGKNDELGTLNRLTPALVQSAAASEIHTGHRINIDWPLDAQSDLPFFYRQQFHKNVYQKYERIVNDDVWTFNTQASSQWDGLRHFGYQKEGLFYNGVTMDDIHGTNGVTATNVNGIGAWAEKGGIVGRGILLDYHSWRQKEGRPYDPFTTVPIPVSDLRAVAAAQGTEIKFGDILLLRTGYTQAYYRLSRSEIEVLRENQPLTLVGLEQSEEMKEFLWTNFSAAGGDHPTLEAWPAKGGFETMLHEVLLAGWGMPIGELFDLEELGEFCKKEGRWSFFFVSKVTNVPGGVASPPNAVAIF